MIACLIPDSIGVLNFELSLCESAFLYACTKWNSRLLFIFALKPKIFCCKKINYHWYNLINNRWFVISFTVLPQVHFRIWCGGISLLKFDNITQLKLRLETIMAWLSLFFHNFKCIHNLCFFNAWRIYDYQDVSDLLILNEFKKSKIGWPRSCKASIFPDVFADFMSESSYRNYGFACCISSQIISDRSNPSS